MNPTQFALNAYRQTNVDAGVAYADPHMLVSMLFNGLQEKLAFAKGLMLRKKYLEKGEAIGRATEILAYLRACLDVEKGGEVAANLDRLYVYMTERLIAGNTRNDPAALDEVNGLVGQVRGAWDGIREQAVKMDARQMERMEG